MDGNKQLILSWIDRHAEELTGFLKELIKIPSDNPPGDSILLARYLQHRLTEFGFSDIRPFEVEQEELHRAGLKKVVNIVCSQTFGSGQGTVVALNAHGDVVPPGLGWSHDPYGGETVDGKIYGRGAAVSKSDLASYTFAVMSLWGVSRNLSGKVNLVFTFDEETGGTVGPQLLLKRGVIQPDMAVAAGFTHSVVNAHNGCLHLEITVKGKSAHAAVPESGHDALEAMTGLLQDLYAYRRRLSSLRSSIPAIESPTLVIGLISGGINTNVVPDECVIRLDRRLIPEENPEQAEAELREIAQALAGRYEGITVEVSRILLANSMKPVPEADLLIKTLVDNAKQILDKNIPVQGSPLYTDTRHFAEAGVPIVMFGAGPETLLEANGHRADENVRIDDLIKATKIMALTLYDILIK